MATDLLSAVMVRVEGHERPSRCMCLEEGKGVKKGEKNISVLHCFFTS